MTDQQWIEEVEDVKSLLPRPVSLEDTIIAIVTRPDVAIQIYQVGYMANAMITDGSPIPYICTNFNDAITAICLKNIGKMTFTYRAWTDEDEALEAQKDASTASIAAVKSAE